MITSVLNYLGRNVIRIFIFCCLLLLTSLGFSQSKILFQDNYESWNLNLWSWRDLPYPTSMVQSSDYPRTGSTFCNKITLNKTDPLVSGNHRAELVWNANAAFNQTNTGVQWIAYSVLLPPSWIDDVNHPESIVNIHDGEPCANSATNPQALWLQTVGGVTHFVYVVNISTVDYCAGGSNQITRAATLDMGAVTKGTWHDFVIHSNWSPNDDGYVQIWHNGTQVVDYHGKCWFKGTFTEPYIKFGDYKFSWMNETAWGGNSLVTTRVFYNDNIKIGSNTATISDFLTTAGPPPANQAPTANAGSNVTITLPTSTANLAGSATDADGTISKYAWTQASGPNTATIASPGTANTALSNLVQGTYTFTLTATDNGGATATDQVTVTVNAAANKPPTANAGNNISITLPTTTANLAGSATDADGTISKYAWTQASGPNTATIASPGTANTSLSNLVQGTYTFTLTATDNGGATATDQVTVTVNAAANQAPTANAGNNISITLPTNTANLAGSATDADGTISKYAWTQASGPNTATIANAGAANTALSNLVQGTYTFTLTATDNGGATATDQVTVTVNAAAVNQAPTANAGSNISITLPTNTANLAGSGSDPDGTISKYAWTEASGPSTATIGNAGAASTSLSNLVQGTYTFNLTVTDNGGKTATDAVSVTVNAAPVNQAPTANAGSNISITLPTNTANLSGSGSDPDGTISKYAWTQASGPSTATIGNAGAASTSLSNLVQGTYTFNFTVTDNGGKTATDAVSVTVNAAPVANKAPVANAGSNMAVTLPTNTVNVNGASSADPDGSISKYTWTEVSGPSTCSFGNSAAATSSVSGLVQGVYAIKLTVTDNLGMTDADTVTVTVNAAPVANQAPVASAGSDFSITLPTSTGSLNGSASSDADGSISKYAWSQVSGPGTATFGNAGAATTSINGLVQGSYVIKLTVTDNLGLSASDQITITVNAAPAQTNKKPVAVPGQNKKIALPTTSTNLNGTSSYDPDGNIVSYSWSQTSGPTSATLGAPASASTNISNLSTTGTYTFKLAVTDNQGAVGIDSVSVVVDPAATAPNQAPLANAGVNLTVVLPTNTVTLNGSASSDADGSIASYAWSQLKGPNVANIGFPNSANSGVSGLVQGDYTFNLVVTDNKGLSASDTVHVAVNPQPAPGPNQAPVANSGGSKSINLPTTSVLLNGASSYDPDGTIASFSWKQISGPSAANIQAPANSSTGIYNMVVGVYEFELTVTDNKGLTATDRSVVTVSNAVAPVPPANVPPVAVANDTTVITLPIQNTSLDGSKSYDSLGGTIVSYSWSYVSGPSVAVLDNTDQAVALAKDLVIGTYVFSLTVTDNQGATDTKNVTVMVMNSATRPQISTVSYYPNPAYWHTTLKVEGSARGRATLQIYNTSGQMVSSQTMWIDQQTFTKEIYLRGYPRGTYYMNLRIGSNKPVVRKLQKL